VYASIIVTMTFACGSAPFLHCSNEVEHVAIPLKQQLIHRRGHWELRFDTPF
jgi:hypothetical protein